MVPWQNEKATKPYLLHKQQPLAVNNHERVAIVKSELWKTNQGLIQQKAGKTPLHKPLKAFSKLLIEEKDYGCWKWPAENRKTNMWFMLRLMEADTAFHIHIGAWSTWKILIITVKQSVASNYMFSVHRLLCTSVRIQLERFLSGL